MIKDRATRTKIASMIISIDSNFMADNLDEKEEHEAKGIQERRIRQWIGRVERWVGVVSGYYCFDKGSAVLQRFDKGAIVLLVIVFSHPTLTQSIPA